jgi:hypothetical protein
VSERQQGLACGLHEHREQPLALAQHDRAQFRRQREDDVKVGHRKNSRASAFEPTILLEILAARTVSVATRVVDRDGVPAAAADVQVSTERRRAAALDRTQDHVLLGAERAAIPQRRTGGTRNVAD